MQQSIRLHRDVWDILYHIYHDIISTNQINFIISMLYSFSFLGSTRGQRVSLIKAFVHVDSNLRVIKQMWTYKTWLDNNVLQKLIVFVVLRIGKWMHERSIRSSLFINQFIWEFDFNCFQKKLLSLKLMNKSVSNYSKKL